MVAATVHAWLRFQPAESGHSVQGSVNQRRVRLASQQLFFGATELGQQYGGLEFRQSKIAAEIIMIIPRGMFSPTAVRIAPAKVGQCLVIRDEDTSFSSGDIFGNLKTKGAATPKYTGSTAFPLAAPGVRRIFHDLQVE